MTIGTEKTNEPPRAEHPDADGLIWYEAHEHPLQLVGFNWFNTDRVFRRMPIHPPEPLPAGVEGLAWCTAGGQVRFRSDSTRLVLKATIRNQGVMDHMAQTGNNGFDLYVGEPGAVTFRSVTRFGLLATEYRCELFKCDRRELRHFTVSFPLYNGVNTLALGLDDGSTVQPPAPWADGRKIVVYGSSITQGGCACRPGMAYTNILSRDLNRPVYNYGFSGSGCGEASVARCIAAVDDASLFILDYEANCHQPGGLEGTLPAFIDIIREKHRTTPILVVSRIHYSVDDERYGARRKVQRDEVRRRQRAGDENIHFLDGAKLLGRSDTAECTVDGVHPTDLGFYRMAKNMAPTIRSILAP